MEHKEIRIDTLRDILLKVYGVYTTICSLDSFIPLETNAPEAMRFTLCFIWTRIFVKQRQTGPLTRRNSISMPMSWECSGCSA